MSSPVLRSERRTRALLLAGAVLFLTYGILLRLVPIIMLNTVGTIAGTVEMVRLWRAKAEQT